MSAKVTAGVDGRLSLETAAGAVPLSAADGSCYRIPPGAAIGPTLALGTVLLVEVTEPGAYRPALVFDIADPLAPTLLADSIEAPGPDCGARIGEAAAPLVAASLQALASADLAPLHDQLAALLPLHERTRQSLAHNAVERAMPGLRHVDVVAPLDAVDEVPLQLAGQPHLVQDAALKALFGRRAQSLFAGLFAGGPFAIHHPVDGEALALHHAIPLSDMHHAYCFNNAARDHPLTLICGVHETAIMALHLPGPTGAEGIVVRNHIETVVSREVRYAFAYIGFDVFTALAVALVARFEHLRPVTAATTPCLVVREYHLGHHLWNELSGIQVLLDAHPRRPFRVLSTQPGPGEQYGPVETLFPQLEGQVDRALIHPTVMLHHAASKDLLLLRHTVGRIPRSLAARLTALAQGRTAAADQAALAEARAAGRPVFLLGLRLDNRTVRDPLAFFAATIAHLRARLGPFTLVLDGMNHPRDAPDAPPGPAAMLERRLVEELAAGLPHGVHLVDTIHRSLDASLFWATGADGFIAIWGGGLAKYRWIANTPGLVLSGAWNIRHRHDFGIYDSPLTMEDPTPLRVISADLVTDIDAGAGNPTLASFDVDLPGWLATIDGYLAEALPAYVSVT